MVENKKILCLRRMCRKCSLDADKSVVLNLPVQVTVNGGGAPKEMLSWPDMRQGYIKIFRKL